MFFFHIRFCPVDGWPSLSSAVGEGRCTYFTQHVSSPVVAPLEILKSSSSNIVGRSIQRTCVHRWVHVTLDCHSLSNQPTVVLFVFRGILLDNRRNFFYFANNSLRELRTTRPAFGRPMSPDNRYQLLLLIYAHDRLIPLTFSLLKTSCRPSLPRIPCAKL